MRQTREMTGRAISRQQRRQQLGMESTNSFTSSEKKLAAAVSRCHKCLKNPGGKEQVQKSQLTAPVHQAHIAIDLMQKKDRL